MSAMSILVQEEAAHIITDGANCVGARLVSLKPKVLAVPHLGIALAYRGRLSVGEYIKFLATNYYTLNAFLADFPRKLAATYAWRTRLFGRHYHFDVGVIGAPDGWPRGWLLSSFDRPGARSFEWARVQPLWSLPVVSADAQRTAFEIAEVDLDAGAAAILADQRSATDCIVGGYGQITTVTGEGISTRVIGHWPDTIGSAVDRGKPMIKPRVAPVSVWR